MKIVRFKVAGKVRYGALEGMHVVEYSGTPFGSFKRARKKYPVKQSVLLAPVFPSKIICVEHNYRDHLEELSLPVPREPLMCLKPPSGICGPDDPIVVPARAERVDYEGELAIVIRRRCRDVLPERARECVLGYTCLNDVTARDFESKDGQLTRAKAYDSFSPVGPCIATHIDPDGVDVQTYLNGEKKQDGNTKRFVFPVAELLARISAVMTLLPGDIISTGTPAGSGPMRPGDKIEVRIEGIGSLANPVVKV